MSPDSYRHRVTAVLVAHDGSRWLPHTLEALRAQTRQPDRLVAVDTGSRDGSASMLEGELGAERLLQLEDTTGFGEAVDEALRHPAGASPAGPVGTPAAGGSEWIWLLHDDCAPAPDTLARLLEAAEQDRRAAVLGPKLVDWLDRRVLLEVGVTADRAGRRETGLEPGELDQGQHDGLHEVLAVSTAGMLVHRDVWDALGGLAAELPLFGDDVDFGWRVNASGRRVLAVGDTAAHHGEGASRGQRPVAVSEYPRRLDRRSGLFSLAANLPGRLAVWALVCNLFVRGTLRPLGFLLAKQPAKAWDELAAYASVVGDPRALLRARRQRGRASQRPYRALRGLLPSRRQSLGRLLDTLNRLSSSGRRTGAGRHSSGPMTATSDPVPSEEAAALPSRRGRFQRLFRSPGLVLFLALAAVALVAERGLLGGGRLGGGALLPVSGGAGDLWSQYLAGWHATGLGSDAPSPPYVAVVALLATVLLGQTWLAVDVMLLGAVPLAGATAYAAGAWVVSDVRIRVWAAASYALLPVATGAVASGRFGTAVAFVLLPISGLLAARMLRLGPREATRAAWGLGGVLAVAAAFVPLVWLLAAAAGFAAYRLWGGSKRGLNSRLLVVLLVPAVLLLPWTPRLFAHPGLFLREAGLPATELLERLGPLSVLLLQPGGPGMPPLWVAAGLVVLGLGALAWRGRSARVVLGWALALLGMAACVVVSRVTVTPPSEGTPAPGWPGVCMALAGAGVIVAGAAGAERGLQRFSGAAARFGAGPGPEPETETAPGGRRHTRRRTRGGALQRRLRRVVPHGRPMLAGAGAVALLACSAPLAAAAFWAYTGVDGPLDRHNPPVLPPFVAAHGEGAMHQRALVVRGTGDGAVSYALVRDAKPLLGSSEIPGPPGLTSRVSSVVAGLASGRRSGQVAELAAHGIKFLVMPGPLDPELIREFNASPQLRRVSHLPGLAVWRLEEPAPRLRMLAGGRVRALPSGPVGARTQLPAGGRDRVVMLAESADPGWWATLDGEKLEPTVVRGWAQGFELPPSGGTLEIGYSSARGWWVSLQALAAVAVVALALPAAREPQDSHLPAGRQRGRGRRSPSRASAHRVRSSGSRRAVPSRSRARGRRRR